MPGLFHDGGYMMGMHGLGWLVLLVLLVILAGVFLFGRGRYADREDDRRETPHEMLRRRLASGDITVAAYEERKAVLDRDGGRST
ncbi:SHOCT domain-containing protein [Polaromonas sp.]|uniref:SHOCT domain-containing protein n=1 Tax=Polaromonas sp. TaxID=1869339 RepID=UPI002488AF8B|nr:SHOCT domain-containing protein [Polaromonas sp.]MDI1274315.1 SHOCT domain-containing protein [Polaromonas sp.]